MKTIIITILFKTYLSLLNDQEQKSEQGNNSRGIRNVLQRTVNQGRVKSFLNFQLLKMELILKGLLSKPNSTIIYDI